MSTESKIKYLNDKIQYAKDYFSYPWLSVASRVALECKIEHWQSEVEKLKKSP